MSKSGRGFFCKPTRELGTYVQFGFVLPEYVRRASHDVKRLPTARATIYYAANVREGPSRTPLGTGLFIEGPHSARFSVTADCDEMVALKVRPGGLRALLGVPAREVRDTTISLEEIWGRSAASLTDRMACASSSKERLFILQDELTRRCRDFDRHDKVALVVAAAVERRSGNVRVSEIGARSGYCQRSLLQRFDDWVGLTPKQHARLARLRSVIARLAPDTDWALLAVAHGYCDQAHMIHEFQDLLGCSPTAFLAQRNAFAPMGAPASGRHAVPRREQRLYRSVGLVSKWLEDGG